MDYNERWQLPRMPWHCLLFHLLNISANCFAAPSEANEPIILGWNNFFSQGNIIRTIAPQEQVRKCRRKCKYSEDRKIAQNASVIVFHQTARGSLPGGRRSEQLYVMFDLESPSHSHPQHPSPDFFNLSMTYLADDEHNLLAPYGALRRIDRSKREHLKDIWTWQEVLTKVGRKDKMALQIASNCASHSGREAYTSELGNYMEITGYGRCFGRDCDKMCYDAQIDRHFFYLAFENSVCRNYVTEKFWNALRQLTVPVVFSRKALKGLNIPPEAFVAADDFGTVEEMAKFLLELRFDQTRYLRFFNWTQFYRRKSDIDPAGRAICRLCEFAHQRLAPGSKVIADIDEYWRLRGNCTRGFVTQFLRKRPIDRRETASKFTQNPANVPPAGFPLNQRLPISCLLSAPLLLLLLIIVIVLSLRRRPFHFPFTLSIRKPLKLIKRRVPIVYL
uniref:Fucosyltransferase n=1 Tax=Globodera rostochiensis TaxID=31243 RepID=A0A914H319_GLORO